MTGLGKKSWAIAVLSIAIILVYPLVWRGDLPQNIDEAVRAVIHFDMVLVSSVIGLLFFRDLIVLPLSLLFKRFSAAVFSQRGTLTLIATALGLVLYGYWNTSRPPVVVDVTLPFPNLPAELEGLTLVQITFVRG